MKICLLAAGAYDITTGVEVKPATANQELANWTKKDYHAQKLIGTSVANELIMHIVNARTSAEMWSKIESVFEKRGKINMLMLNQQFFNLTKENNESIVTFMARMDEIVHQLKSLGQEMADQMVIAKVIMALPDQYQSFSCAWESTAADDRTLDNLKMRLVMEEDRMIARGEKDIGEALYTKHQRKKFNKKETNFNTDNYKKEYSLKVEKKNVF